MSRSLSGLIFAGLVAAAAPAQAMTVLDGWGAFKFGMSPDQIRALPGQSFGRFSAKNLLEQNQGAMASKKPVPVYGAPYSLDLFFNSFQALNEISLQNQKTTAQPECQAAFLALLAQLEKTYGKLSPVYPEEKKDDQALLPISVEWKASPGASRYQLATAYLSGETAYVWNARILFGDRYLDAATVWSAPHDSDQAVCLMELNVKA